MGEKRVKKASDVAVLKRFMKAMLRDLKALEEMLDAGMIESGVQRIGVEQELCLVDRSWRPAPVVMELLKKLRDKHFTTEYAKFNMELNLDPLPLTGDCFTKMETQLLKYLGRLQQVANGMDTEIIMVGILPTIRKMDLEPENMTPLVRYEVLDETLHQLRGGEPFELRIRGIDELITNHKNSLLESCNTSFQVHFQVDPDAFANQYNIAQVIAAPVLSATTNSPFFLGKRLWRETRIALFQQSIDTRNASDHLREQSPRVSFGTGWLEDSILEIFHDDVSRFRVLVSAAIKEDSLEMLEAGRIPALKALQVFNGTVYRWNRPCYGIMNGKPHLRIENRVFPSGPTVVDEVANAAFWVGLMNGFPAACKNIARAMSFEAAKENFHKVARVGLDAQLDWTKGRVITCDKLILKELIPIAREGLIKAKIQKDDIRKYLDIIEARVSSRKKGSQWMLESYSKLSSKSNKTEAIVAITAGIVNRQKVGIPVHKWKPAKLAEAGSWANKYWFVDQIMSTDLFTVQSDDIIDLATKIMDWKHVRHIPVEDDRGRLVGLITSGTLLHHYGSQLERRGRRKTVVARDIMVKKPVSVSTGTLTLDAISIMRKDKIGCLPVVREGKLVGIVTEHDFVNISAGLLEELFVQNQSIASAKTKSKKRSAKRR